MTEQPPSAEAMTLLSEILGSCGKAGLCRFPPCSCAEAIDALIAQRVSAERERFERIVSAWDPRSGRWADVCYGNDAIKDMMLHHITSSHDRAPVERPAPEGPQLSSEAWAYLAGLGSYGPTDVEEAARLYPMPVERPAPSALAFTGAAAVDYTAASQESDHGLHDTGRVGMGAAVRGVPLRDNNAAGLFHVSAAVADYTERARQLAREWADLDASGLAGDWESFFIRVVARALSAVASERDAAAIRAFGKRVWSDTEEVAYLAGARDEQAAVLARLREPAMREAVTDAFYHACRRYTPGTTPGWDHLADAAIARIVEMLT